MGGSDGWGGPAARSFAGCAALALALSGCGPIASVGSTLYSGSEALATIAKQTMEGEAGKPDDTGDDPE